MIHIQMIEFKNFQEIKYGNVETYQEMENIKKIIASKYSLNVAVFNSKN